MHQKKKTNYIDKLLDVCYAVSIIGIWPRFVEPKLLSLTSISFTFSQLPKDLNGLRILQFSDLHWGSYLSSSFLQQLIERINELEPDLIVFTGDLLSRAQLVDKEGLKQFLNSLNAPLGYFAVLGNHDYAQFVTLNLDGDYDVEPKPQSNLVKGWKRLWYSPRQPRGRVTETAHQMGYHKELMQILQETPFRVLNNETECIRIKDSYLNICGLEEYTLGRAQPAKAFETYQREHPGIVLVHHPDCIPYLDEYPGQIVLSGHTHGGQINLPWIWKKFAYLENPEFKQGLIKRGNKWLYINRGVGSVLPLRWYSRPELTLITLNKEMASE